MTRRKESSSFVSKPAPRAVLVAPRLNTPNDVLLAELTSLLEGLGMSVLRTLSQKHTPLDSPHLLGKGKLEEVKQVISEMSNDAETELVVVVASEVTPAEQRMLERTWGVRVLDRTAVILRVFEQRAQTRLARLEVELARLTYELPRIRDDQSLGDREGGGGRGGRGHSNVELAKQRARKAIAEVRKRIDDEQATLRQQRQRRSHVPHAALVGYTNAGKSSLMRALTGSDVLVEDKLFATLGTTVRAISGASPRVLLSDTVGFLRELPHGLVQSFRSTLETSLDAGLLVHVVDASDAELTSQIEVTRRALEEVGGGALPTLLVFCKVDQVSSERKAELEEAFPTGLFVCTFDDEDVARLREEIVSFFEKEMIETTICVPFGDGKRLAELRSVGRVVRESTVDTGVVVTLRVAPHALKDFVAPRAASS